jgi:hypothetical protein
MFPWGTFAGDMLMQIANRLVFHYMADEIVLNPLRQEW